MAEQQPGSIITPGGTPGGQPSAPAPTPEKPQEVAAPQPAQPTTPPVAPEVPQQPQPASPPTPTSVTAAPPPPVPTPAPQQPQPPAQQPQTPPAQPEPSPESEAPPTQPTQGFATSGFTESQTGQTGTAYDMPQTDEPPLNLTQQADGAQISWTASEYIAHQKSSSWYLALAVGTLLLLVPIYFITNGDIVALVTIAFAVVVFAVYAGKKPRELEYAIHANGITIGSKTYAYHQFKTFSVVDEGAFSSIMFMPMSRFMPAISIYYDPKDEETIIETLSNYLPLDTQKRDLVDNLMRKIRF